MHVNVGIFLRSIVRVLPSGIDTTTLYTVLLKKYSYRKNFQVSKTQKTAAKVLFKNMVLYSFGPASS